MYQACKEYDSETSAVMKIEISFKYIEEKNALQPLN